MKTIRLVMLLALIFLALLGTSRAAGGTLDEQVQVFLPVVLKDWKPITQTRFFNASQDLVRYLKVDDRELITEADPLSPGEAVTVQLPIGQHSYTVTLAQMEGVTSVVQYHWSESFTQYASQTVVINISHPTIAHVMSGFGDEMHWDFRIPGPLLPTGFCFYRDGSFLAFEEGGCPWRGTIEEIAEVTTTRIFKFLDESHDIRYSATLHIESSHYFDLHEGDNQLISLGTYDHALDPSCPPVPTDCPVSSD